MLEQILLINNNNSISFKKIYNEHIIMYFLENSIEENIKIYNSVFKEFNKKILYISQIDKALRIQKKNYIKILNINNVGDIWINCDIYSRITEKDDFLEYMAIGLSNIFVIGKVYNIKEAFEKLDYALNIGKEVYAFPGEIYKRNNYFSNFAIKQGANVICNKYDVKGIIKQI